MRVGRSLRGGRNSVRGVKRTVTEAWRKHSSQDCRRPRKAGGVGVEASRRGWRGQGEGLAWMLRRSCGLSPGDRALSSSTGLSDHLQGMVTLTAGWRVSVWRQGDQSAGCHRPPGRRQHRDNAVGIDTGQVRESQTSMGLWN